MKKISLVALAVCIGLFIVILSVGLVRAEGYKVQTSKAQLPETKSFIKWDKSNRK